MRDLPALLADLGLGKYEAAFAAHEVDLEALVHLTDEDFAQIGIPVGPRRKIMAALRSSESAAPAARSEPPAPASDTHTDRRPVTVVFADLVGYTALSRTVDAEELAQIVQAYFRCVDQIAVDYGGIVERHIGDCVMAVFGVPVARGNDTERAVAAALAIVAAMPGVSSEAHHPLSVHIGVASGQVVASRSGDEGSPVFTVTGESVNLASRLADAAPAGEIYLSDRVRGELGQRLSSTEVGTLDIQGFEKPVRTFRALGLRPVVSQHALVGRRIELAQLRAILDLARQEGGGHIVHLRGEAGIGKTRLLEEILADAGRRGFTCHAVHVVDFGRGVGQDAVGVLVRSLIGLPRCNETTEPPPATAFATPEDALFLTALAGAPHTPALKTAYMVLDEAARDAGKRAALRRLIERASGEGALALAVEDLHWADATTLSYLAEIAAVTKSCPAVLIATSRPELEPLDRLLRIGPSGASLTTIDLGPLAPSDARVLADRVFSGGADIISRCLERANGNPLFLEQLLRHALEGESASVPATVASLVQARLDRLSLAERTALQAASVLGKRFNTEALAAVLDQAEIDPDRLTAQGLLTPVGSELVFAHALIHEAIYESLLKSRRTELHLRAARWFAERDLSLKVAHLDRAGCPTAPHAYLEAARFSADRFQYAQAKALLERGLELARDDADRYALASLAGHVLHAMGRLPEALAAYESALAAAASDLEICRARIGSAAVKRLTDDIDGAFRDLDAAQTIAEANEASLERARIHYLRGSLYFPKGDIAGCIREHERSLALARSIGACEQEAAALGGLGDAQYMLGRMRSAAVRFSECVEVSASRGFTATEAANRPMLAFMQWYAGDTRAAAAQAADAIRLARSIGHQRAEMIAHHCACFALHALTEYGPALEHAETALRLARQLGAQRFEVEGLVLRAKVLLALGRPREARPDIEAAIKLGRATGMAFLGPVCLGALAAATDDPDEASAAMDEADRLLAAGAISHNHLMFRQDAINLCLARGDLERAARYARELAAYTSKEPFPWSQFYVERADVLLRFARGERGPELTARLRALQADADRYGYLRDRPELGL